MSIEPYRPNRQERSAKRGLIHALVIVLSIAIGLALAVIAVGAFVPEVRKNQELQTQLNELSLQVSAEEARLADLRHEIQLLRNNPEYLEIVARDILGLMRPGEMIYRVRETSTQ
ncbi:MAG: septum formation initiator family protein [Verrucomicrobiales bacterium]